MEGKVDIMKCSNHNESCDNAMTYPCLLYENTKKVRDILELLSYGTSWRLVGARTGKTLCTNLNTDTCKSKYLDLPVPVNPIFVDMDVNKRSIIVDNVRPRVCIWVIGE